MPASVVSSSDRPPAGAGLPAIAPCGPEYPALEAGQLIRRTRQAMLRAGHRCGEIRWNHATGRHWFPVHTPHGAHRIMACPPEREEQA